MSDFWNALILGLVEGLTEFIPVSSTGHLLLTKEALGLEDAKWDTFIVMIQLGAILAVVALYFRRLWDVFIRLPSDPQARRFAWTVLLAFLPSALLGLAVYGFIKACCSRARRSICVSLIVGRLRPAGAGALRAEAAPGRRHVAHWKTSLGVGPLPGAVDHPGRLALGATISAA
jgi:undecaprenyl-diphosphatase